MCRFRKRTLPEADDSQKVRDVAKRLGPAEKLLPATALTAGPQLTEPKRSDWGYEMNLCMRMCLLCSLIFRDGIRLPGPSILMFKHLPLGGFSGWNLCLCSSSDVLFPAHPLAFCPPPSCRCRQWPLVCVADISGSPIATTTHLGALSPIGLKKTTTAITKQKKKNTPFCFIWSHGGHRLLQRLLFFCYYFCFTKAKLKY